MKAIVHTRYGGPEVLRLEDIPRPVPAPDEVLVRVRATTVNRTDCGFRSATPWFARFFTGWRGPRFRVLGSEFAGDVVEVGADVTAFAVGDRVFGVNQRRFGGNAEYMINRETDPITTIPEGVSYEEAAAIPDGFVLGRTCLTATGVGPGTRLLVYGASGSIGSATVQLAIHLGAEVTAVCDTAGLDVVRSLRPARLIDYTAEPFLEPGVRYDVIIDAVGKLSFRRVRRALAPDGRYATTDLGWMWHQPLMSVATRFVGRQRAMLPLPSYRTEHVLLAKELLEAGAYRAIIDRRYPLEETVEATRYVESERKIGNVVLLVGEA
ncbi:MAG TPA: NAD(P)-dependent alcohol dehydrogenase [Candidatus Limnocylindrales bacterium]|nr:NAD(P)-dependent alcohol dehydrogenase [Candidatus Limnocylindrales bacterium]